MNGERPAKQRRPMPARMFAAALAALVFVAIPASAQDRPSSQERPSFAEGRAASSTVEVLRSMERASLRVARLLDASRDQVDRERTLCVDARLSELHSALRLAVERAARMQRAASRGDAAMAARERALVTRLGENARAVEAAARACVDPEPALPSGRTQVVVTIDPSVPRDAIQPAYDERRGALR